jgi:hypothetical protein
MLPWPEIITQSVEPAALQPDVEEDQAGPPAGDGRQRIVTVARGARQVALVLQDAGNQLPYVGFVVDDQNVRCHGHLLVAIAGVLG